MPSYLFTLQLFFATQFPESEFILIPCSFSLVLATHRGVVHKTLVTPAARITIQWTSSLIMWPPPALGIGLYEKDGLLSGGCIVYVSLSTRISILQQGRGDLIEESHNSITEQAPRQPQIADYGAIQTLTEWRCPSPYKTACCLMMQ